MSVRLRCAWLLVATAAIGLSAAGTSVKLIDAVRAGDRQAARALIRQRVDVNAREPRPTRTDG